MATNGNSNNNGSLGRTGQVESDSTFSRLRNDLHKKEETTCLSCGALFYSTSTLEIFEHFKEKVHIQYYRDCLYCGGKVHKYQTKGKEEFFHNCSRWKCGEEK